jgi:hypothetical protein
LCDLEPSSQAQQQQQPVETAPIVPRLELPPQVPPHPPAQISPRQEALSLMAEKKRQKWMREKGRHFLMHYGRKKSILIWKKKNIRSSIFIISFAAEMDRMKLEVEYDQLKHQLSPHHDKMSSSPGTIPSYAHSHYSPIVLERVRYPYEPPVVNKPPPAPPLPMSLKQIDHHDVPPKSNGENIWRRER